MKSSLFRLLLLVSTLTLGLGFVSSVHAEDLGAVKARMSKRLTTLDHLKEKGALGENNRGFVEVRGSAPDAAAVAAAENKDREVVYAAIAKQTGSSAEQVGKARARQIAGGSAPGVWLQRDDGGWYRK